MPRQDNASISRGLSDRLTSLISTLTSAIKMAMRALMAKGHLLKEYKIGNINSIMQI